MEQWKVITGKFRRTFSKFQGAKREYGIICREIERDEEGLVQMFYREDLNSDWKCIEEFGYEDPNEEDEDEDED